MSLGRGLGALITPTKSVSRKIVKDSISKADKKNTDIEFLDNSSKIWNIPISEIFADENQPRKHFSKNELNELSLSIKEHGILQPILLSEKKDGKYKIIAGERRFRASTIAGLTTIPAIVKQLSNQVTLEISLIENIQRENLNPLEEAFAYRRLIDEFDLTQQKVADKVGKSRSAVANAVRLLELPDDVQKALVEKSINSGQARALLSLKDEKEQLSALASILGKKITVREIEKLTQRKSNKEKQGYDPNLAYLEEKVRVAIGTKVKIAQRGDGGKIILSYYSKEELGRIINKIIDE